MIRPPLGSRSDRCESGVPIPACWIDDGAILGPDPEAHFPISRSAIAHCVLAHSEFQAY